MYDNEQRLQELYSQILRPGDFVIDVGAHLGRHTMPMAECVGGNGMVWAFEPIPAIRQALAATVDSRQMRSSVRIFENALADSPGRAQFQVVNEAPGYSGLRERHYDLAVTRTPIEVDVQTLDGLVPASDVVRFIKVDCEGAELLVLRGGSETIKRCRPIITVESGDSSLTHYPHTSGDLFDFLDSNGYLIANLEGVFHQREEFIRANAAQAYWDYIAIPSPNLELRF